MPRRQPRCPSIGLNSCSSWTRRAIFSTATPSFCASSFCWVWSLGRNSWRGGSRKRIVAGKPSSASKIPMKSFRWYGSNFANARPRSEPVSARIISRIASIRSPSKNMCSVRQRPIPCAPNATAFLTCSGVSAFVRTPSVRNLSTHRINFAYSRYVSLFLPSSVRSIRTWTISDGAVVTSPAKTLPTVPSSET